MVGARNRIRQQAFEFELFENVNILNERDLESSFKAAFNEKLKFGTRGFGYWVWKPQTILQNLQQIKDGDIILYLDIGTHINPNGKNRFQDYIELLLDSQDVVMSTELDVKELEMKWTKEDLFRYFNVHQKKIITHTPQIQSGAIFLKNSPAARSLVRDWLEVYRHDFTLADDTPSKSQNSPKFVEHRHDQSIFSILAKLSGLQKISNSETLASSESGNTGRRDWTTLKDFPIHFRRDKSFGNLPIHTRIIRKILRS